MSQTFSHNGSNSANSYAYSFMIVEISEVDIVTAGKRNSGLSKVNLKSNFRPLYKMFSKRDRVKLHPSVRFEFSRCTFVKDSLFSKNTALLLQTIEKSVYIPDIHLKSCRIWTKLKYIREILFCIQVAWYHKIITKIKSWKRVGCFARLWIAIQCTTTTYVTKSVSTITSLPV